MKSNLDQLINFWRDEKSTLENKLQDCIDQSDFKSADHYSKIIGIVNQKLRTLEKLVPGNQLKVKELEQQIEAIIRATANRAERAKKTYNADKDEKLLELKIQRIEQNKKDAIDKILDQLSSLKKENPKGHIDSQNIEDSISKILEKEISGFKIYLSKPDNFYLKCTINSNLVFNIETPREDTFNTQKWLCRYQLDRLLVIGFNYSESRTKLTLQEPIENKDNPMPLKNILARTIYDVYGNQLSEKEIFLEYI